MSGCVVHVLGEAGYDVYVGRAMPRYGLAESIFANPFKVGPMHDRSEALRLYEGHLRRMLLSWTSGEEALLELRGLTLGCWCARRNGPPLTLEDPEICHAQVMMRLIEELARERVTA